ncbi:MAG: ABC transporter permease [Candidatus Ornithomonoglobus sp.]
MKAIFKRELRSYFSSMPGYIFLAMFLLLAGVLFYLNNIVFGVTSVKNLFQLLTTWAVFILPILTMRLFAEDRKLKTDQLLMTAPVSVKSIVLGKFLAAFTMVAEALFVMLIYTIIISFFGTVNWAETISCFIGFALLCAVVLSIGTFMSSLTDSQIVAAISTYAILIVTVFLGNIASAASGILKSALLWISPTERFLDFAMGILDPSALVYYISLTVLFLFLTVSATERRRFA